MSQPALHRPSTGHEGATMPVVRSGWTALRLLAARWSARQRLSGSIAHLDDRLLADAGFTPWHLGVGERLIRRYAAGGGIWAAGSDRNQRSGFPRARE
jgi:hypothetical protein